MARYISLLRFTEQGAKKIKESTKRAHAFDKIAAKSGVKIEGRYLDARRIRWRLDRQC